MKSFYLEPPLAFLSLLSFLALCWWRTLKSCIVSRMTHFEMGCIKIDSLPIDDENIESILDMEDMEDNSKKIKK